jgi:CDP-diacylglycerol--serine O-phosphatidyltransferase
MTIGGLVLGMRAIAYAFQGRLVPSAYMIGFAGVIDALDGGAARLLNAQSLFGKYLDTLSDAVTVGVAPAVLLYAVYFRAWGGFGFLLTAGWAVAVLARLAYFQATEDSDPAYFTGLPSPLASNILTGFVLFSAHVWHHFPYIWLVVALMALFSYLMLSKLRVEKGAFFTPERLVRSWQGRAALLGVVLTAIWPWACQIVVFSTVVVLALLREGLRRVRSWRAAVATVRFRQVEGVATHE